jgi:hypothetical protein
MALIQGSISRKYIKLLCDYGYNVSELPESKQNINTKKKQMD